MSNATLDRLLALLIVVIAATGLLSLRAGAPDTRWLFVAHGVIGGTLLAAVALKLWRSLPRAIVARRWLRLLLGLGVSALALGALLIGFAATAAGELVVVGPWTLISWHAAIGVALVPLVLAHLLPRRWRLLRPRFRSRPSAARPRSGPRLTRRTLLAAGALSAAGVALWSGAEILDRVQGGVRRFTGSRWLPRGGVPPPTTFFGEGVPSIDAASWRLSITGRVARPVSLSLADLAALGEQTTTAVLDCTSGWAMETDWTGVPLGRLLDAAMPADGASTVEVRAVTGWGAALSIEDARASFLATGVAGQPLPAPNGAPCRLVVPHRRGLDWVKWVSEVEVG